MTIKSLISKMQDDECLLVKDGDKVLIECMVQCISKKFLERNVRTLQVANGYLVISIGDTDETIHKILENTSIKVVENGSVVHDGVGLPAEYSLGDIQSLTEKNDRLEVSIDYCTVPPRCYE